MNVFDDSIGFYSGDPDNNGQEINFYKFLERTGFLKKYKERTGKDFPATHNAQLLINQGQKLFEKLKEITIKEQRLNEVTTSENDIKILYTLWLKSELELVSTWLNRPKDFPSSHIIEITKYKDYLNDELINTKGEIIESKHSKKTKPRNYISLAFYYYYRQTVGEIEWFDNWTGGRQNAYMEVVCKHFSDPAKTAWKQFQTEYVKIEAEHSNNRWQLCNRQSYLTIIEMLQKDNSKALPRAKEELKKSIE